MRKDYTHITFILDHSGSMEAGKVSGARCATTNEAYISSTTFSEEDTRSLN
jgi:hypothetical protein